MALLFKKTGDVKSPTIGTPGSAGIDLYMPCDVTLSPFFKQLIDLRVAFEIPEGYVGILTQRSSSGKVDVSLANTIGWIDSDFRESLKVFVKYIPTHLAGEPHSSAGWGFPSLELSKDKAYFQLVIVPFYAAQELKEVEDLTKTERVGGFGSTDKPPLSFSFQRELNGESIREAFNAWYKRAVEYVNEYSEVSSIRLTQEECGLCLMLVCNSGRVLTLRPLDRLGVDENNDLSIQIRDGG